jgi:hypothetical protein
MEETLKRIESKLDKILETLEDLLTEEDNPLLGKKLKGRVYERL